MIILLILSEHSQDIQLFVKNNYSTLIAYIAKYLSRFHSRNLIIIILLQPLEPMASPTFYIVWLDGNADPNQIAIFNMFMFANRFSQVSSMDNLKTKIKERVRDKPSEKIILMISSRFLEEMRGSEILQH